MTILPQSVRTVLDLTLKNLILLQLTNLLIQSVIATVKTTLDLTLTKLLIQSPISTTDLDLITNLVLQFLMDCFVQYTLAVLSKANQMNRMNWKPLQANEGNYSKMKILMSHKTGIIMIRDILRQYVNEIMVNQEKTMTIKGIALCVKYVVIKGKQDAKDVVIIQNVKLVKDIMDMMQAIVNRTVGSVDHATKADATTGQTTKPHKPMRNTL
uniref:Uncharacterized protein n=1 Tax=Cacopsylla melanoneura TaxID=428564 RepID=A0A8D8S8H5_9HEMI